jgi:hypothetical protein
MRRFAAGAFALALAGLPAAARADLFSSVSYGAHIGTTGAGITLEKPLLYDFSVRITTNNLSVSQQLSYDTTHYTSTNHYQNVGIIGDFRPYGGRYRISAGLLFGNDRIINVAQQQGPVIAVGSGFYPVAGTGQVTTQVRFDRPTIYAGVGTGTGLIPGFALTLDAGFEIRNGHASGSATGPLANDPAFQASLGQLVGELRTHQVSPVVSIGLVYRP